MLKSPAEDFVTNTLGSISGVFGKLQYVAGLRQGPSDYFHWGMARAHGDGTASMTIARAHADIFGELLRSPVRSLWEEIRSADSDDGVTGFVQALVEKKDALIPPDLSGGSKRHFNSVLLGLSGLAASLEPRTDRGA
jgi:hypothetical protein